MLGGVNLYKYLVHLYVEIDIAKIDLCKVSLEFKIVAILYALLHILSVLTLQRLEPLKPSHMYLFFFTRN